MVRKKTRAADRRRASTGCRVRPRSAPCPRSPARPETPDCRGSGRGIAARWRHVLDADADLVAAHLDDAIDHQERIAVRQAPARMFAMSPMALRAASLVPRSMPARRRGELRVSCAVSAEVCDRAANVVADLDRGCRPCVASPNGHADADQPKPPGRCAAGTSVGPAGAIRTSCRRRSGTAGCGRSAPSSAGTSNRSAAVRTANPRSGRRRPTRGWRVDRIG